MRRLYGPTCEVDSCGLEAGEEVDPLAAAVMAEVGVDLTRHQPKRLADLIADRRFSQVVAVSEEAWLEVKASGGALNWPIPDPAQGEGSREMRLEAYRLTRQALQALILERFGPPSVDA